MDVVLGKNTDSYHALLMQLPHWQPLAKLWDATMAKTVTLIQSRHRTVHQLKDPLHCPIIPIPYPDSTPLIPDFRSPLVCLQCHNFTISRMIYKWNHILCKLSGLPFFTQHNSLEFYLSYSECSFLLLSSILWGGPTNACLTIHLKDVWVASNLGSL